ncbi:DUF3592 domain-containing protein [candidate division KSB1 bacterium]|nr:DUF3592 domain-containing protein [candidate division KSB1 bacterium]
MDTRFHNSREGSIAEKRPRIEYDYFVNDEKFHGSNYGNIDGIAESIVANYPVGKEVTVFYNPQNPCESVLNPEK